MGSRRFQVGRRNLLQAVGAAGIGAAVPVGFASAAAADGAGTDSAGADSAGAEGVGEVPDVDVAGTYHRILLRHTRWSETLWDEAKGHYTATDFGFAVVLGHAVLLTHGRFDEQLAGVDRETLRRRTLATLRHFAVSNRLTGGSEWGRTLFWDTTFQSYFVLAAHLLWDELDAGTRSAIDTIVREQAAYTHSLGTGDDPDSGDWTPNGLEGGYVGDTKLEEMGVYAQSLAPALAWAYDDERVPDWTSDYGAWSRNEGGLPPADLANPTPVDGVPVSRNTAHNTYDTFLVENHGSFGPHYQAEMWRTSGRNAAHFLAAGRPLPEVLTRQPNAEELWRTLLGVMSDAGEPLQPLVDDREHLYGRDVIPLAFLSRVIGDRAAARAELDLAARLEAYQDYPPENRLTKFSGEPKYEPEARAELAISYLLHVWPDAGPGVPPLSRAELFEYAAGVTDFGTGPGLVSQQSPAAWAGVVTKPGFVKFGWQPGHDDWLFRIGGETPMFLPTTAAEVTGRSVRTHTVLRDGFDGSATVLRLGDGFAGYATLPSGAVVYAVDGTNAGGSRLELHNLTMPGVPGLNGSRTYRFAEGMATVPAQDADDSRSDAGAWSGAGADAGAAAPAVRSRGGWLDIDGRAGLVVRGGEHPITVYGDRIKPADGARTPILVEGHCNASPADLAALARGPAPVPDDDRLLAALTDEHLSLFNLSADELDTRVRVPLPEPDRLRVFEGEQTVTSDGMDYEARLPSASARLLAPRFTLDSLSGNRLPPGLRVRVTDGANLLLSGADCRLRIEGQGRVAVASVRSGHTTRVEMPGARPYPIPDHALGRTTFPTAPLPPGMSPPGNAVDGDPETAWYPGPAGRMVVDLGVPTAVRELEVRWTNAAAPDAYVEVSLDGLDYRRVGDLAGRGRVRRLAYAGPARYVAVAVRGAVPIRAGITQLSVR